MQTTKFPFPIRNPALQGDDQIPGRTKQVEMIRHQQIMAHDPSVRGKPDLSQRVLDVLCCQPALTIFGADGDKNNRRLLGRNQNAARRMFSSGFFKRRIIGHKIIGGTPCRRPNQLREGWRVADPKFQMITWQKYGDGETPSLPIGQPGAAACETNSSARRRKPVA